MGPRPVPAPPCPEKPDFNTVRERMAAAALHEIGPAGAGEEAAALGMALGLAAHWSGRTGLIWAGEEAAFAEEGAPYPAGLAQFGIDPEHLLVIRARRREEALWAAEQGLAIAGAVVLCALGAQGKPLDLKATRRLLLTAERNGSRCLLLKPEDAPTAAWTRWRVEAASSRGVGRELGAPVFRATLTRNRAGPAGQSFVLEWNAHERAFRELALDLAAASGDRSADPVRRRA
ncbi:MAG TPA: hypothetical protein VG943_15415 [Caulobacterales bacterium]|nr:hypothetical protein [Caulobacterales bacterium]